MYGSIGKTAITTVPLSTNQAILGLEPRPGVNPEYLYYSLINARLALFSNAKGTSQKNINGRMVKTFKVPKLPPEMIDSVVTFLSSVEDGANISELDQIPQFLAEPRRIVARIEELASRIEEARELRRRAVEETSNLLASESDRLFSKLCESHEPRSFESFNPHVTSGPRNWGAKYSNSGLRFYRAQDIGPNGNVLDSSKVFIIPPDTNQGKSAKLTPGDLMIVITGATVGRCTVFPVTAEPGYVSQNVAICRLLSSEIDPHFVLWVYVALLVKGNC
ncbi:MAG: restriction endonuclease subunit S [Methanotrichaceae archaeon]|jgi:type I restriction enzyme S subunit